MSLYTVLYRTENRQMTFYPVLGMTRRGDQNIVLVTDGVTGGSFPIAVWETEIAANFNEVINADDSLRTWATHPLIARWIDILRYSNEIQKEILTDPAHALMLAAWLDEDLRKWTDEMSRSNQIFLPNLYG